MFLFFFFLLHCSAWVIFAPQPGIEPHPQQRKCRVLTTGPPGNSYLRLCRQDFQNELVVFPELVVADNSESISFLCFVPIEAISSVPLTNLRR